MTIFNTDSNSVTSTIELPACLGPRCTSFGVAVSADGRFAYVAEASSDTIHVLNTETRTVISSIRVDGGPRGIALLPPPRVVAPDPAEGIP
ncbi:MAG: hypothetical protein HY235_10915 [Acidobacteria bacterium]|nr:hypothetical protein [Acidobacteriota bacterium]